MMYRKVMFRGPSGSTADLVITSDWITKNATHNFTAAVSHLYPMSEALKMHRLYLSPEFKSWDAAFAFQFGDT